ncbi:LOW QUALITY PROTEIN: uncharacterized protein LOC117508137 [Thalassophryne amazonica]|uniref:LOW QUALITY PROTEIN: uncharacterized protein LOC117508137 n=1 Tax=Thalassophryne amazonica TaxID=390379 RepID=UPI0014717914|nr:LOW QUALITY PROTEIN: uncharacterized protein LOC117508137 [Thalassophryne amazonica]
MPVKHTWACLLLCFCFSTQDKIQDVHVTCIISEECVLPCSFAPGSQEVVEWFKQDVVVYSFQRDDGDSSEEHKQINGRFYIFPHLVSQGNAMLVFRESSPKDRGKYRCHVHTSEGVYEGNVFVKVEARIQGLTLELSRLSGYEEMKCSIDNVYPAPQVTWATEPPTFEVLRPLTRKMADKRGLYSVHSRLRRITGQPDLIYICKVTSPYGGPAWAASMREREIRGTEGRDLTIPCHAPSYLYNPSLRWSFSNGKDHANILTFEGQMKHSNSLPTWEGHVEVDGFKVLFGDGSLRLMDPDHLDHTGSYTCVLSMPYNTHTERSDIIIDVQQSHSEKASHWWIIVVVVAVLLLALVGMLVYLKMKGHKSKPRNDPEEATELHSVKEPNHNLDLSWFVRQANSSAGCQHGCASGI